MEGVSGVTGLVGASGIVVSPDGLHVYVAGSGSDAVAAFRRDGPNGELTFIQAYSGLIRSERRDRRDRQRGRQQRLRRQRRGRHGDGLPAGRGHRPALVRGRVHAVPNRKTPRPKRPARMRWRRCTGRWPCRRTENTCTPWAGMSAISIVDLVGHIDVFARNAESGLLSKAQSLRNDEGGVRGLRTPTSVTVSADGANVYATSVRDSASPRLRGDRQRRVLGPAVPAVHVSRVEPDNCRLNLRCQSINAEEQRLPGVVVLRSVKRRISQSGGERSPLALAKSLGIRCARCCAQRSMTMAPIKHG